MEERKQLKEVMDRKMAALVEHFSKFNEVKKQIRKGLGTGSACLLHPGIEQTNNLSERVISGHVLMRKIIGAFRSENGAEYCQYIASVFATWRLQGKDILNKYSSKFPRICFVLIALALKGKNE